jgi:hypothetical protein
MDWRTRIAAIVLAGGTVAGCAGSSTDPPDAAPPDPGPRSTTDPTAPVLDPALRSLVSPRKPRWRIPICNANPDPCCRTPQASSCTEGASPADRVR